jgi:hypothetical protein
MSSRTGTLTCRASEDKHPSKPNQTESRHLHPACFNKLVYGAIQTLRSSSILGNGHRRLRACWCEWDACFLALCCRVKS